jgi:O-antigen/teichoic acid export membrane protein
LLYAAMGLGPLLLGCAALAVEPTAISAMAAVAVGAVVPAVVGAVALRRTAHDHGAPPTSHPRSVLAEALRNSHALLAFFALSSCDILVARAVLDDHASGLYAGGLILTKAVLFLPQFVVVLVFPSMSADTSRRRTQAKALGLILGLGLAAVALAAAAPELAVIFVGGAQYAEIATDLWAFAVLGTMLAMTQLEVYAVVARQQAAAVYVLWGGLLGVLALTILVDSVDSLLAVMVGVLGVVLLGLGLAGRRSPGPGRAPRRPAGTKVGA